MEGIKTHYNESYVSVVRCIEDGIYMRTTIITVNTTL